MFIPPGRWGYVEPTGTVGLYSPAVSVGNMLSSLKG